jgi:hypothetical protein
MTEKEQVAVLKEEYRALMHAVQSGVGFMLDFDSREGTAKHLRVGVNSALINQCAIIKLLINRGVITELEYWESVVEQTKLEILSYEEKLNTVMGSVRLK